MADQKVVYVLDDDPDIRRALERLLSTHGYHSCLFASVAEFYSKAKPRQAVCLIVDIQLNGAGLELKRQLSHSDPECQSFLSPVVILRRTALPLNR